MPHAVKVRENAARIMIVEDLGGMSEWTLRTKSASYCLLLAWTD
jgi:hypothetical protein